MIPGTPLGPVGSAGEFASIRVEKTLIRAVEDGVRGVSETNGLRRLAGALRSEIVCTVGYYMSRVRGAASGCGDSSRWKIRGR